MNYDIVICFRSDDLESAKNLKAWLENNGYKDRVSLSSVNFGGGPWNPIMHDRIEKCMDCIVIISDLSFKRSWFFQKDYLIEELEHAAKTNKRIIPVIKDYGHYNKEKRRYLPKKISAIISRFNQLKYHHKEDLGLEMCMRQMTCGELPFLVSKPHMEDSFYKNVDISQNTFMDSASYIQTKKQEAV